MNSTVPVLAQQYLDAILAKEPAKTAVTDGNRQYTYREIEELSNRLANCLIHNGVGRQQCVVFCLQRSVHCLVAILGILKADAIYVPVDHKSPAERLGRIIEDCRPGALICDASTRAKFAVAPGSPGCDRPVISLAPAGDPESPGQIRHFGSQRPCPANGEDDTAYILYTSGSTGKPKGVMTSHRNIRNYIDWAVEFLDIGADDRILSTAPFHFDMSTFDIFCPLKAGATLCIARDNLLLFPEMLMRFMEQEGITIWKGISSLLMYFERAGILGKDRIPTLEKILFGGESLPAKYLIRWMETYPGKLFYNAYGPTEATGVSLCYPVPAIPKHPGERIPIGKPCKDAIVLLLNDDHSLAGEGEVGELCITGACLSKGYLNDPEKTARAFIPNSFHAGGAEYVYKTGDLAMRLPDGNYEFIDRKDNQVKFLGYRIELSEIEHALRAVPQVKDAAVQLLDSAHEGLAELVAFYEADEDVVVSGILAVLETRLPKYMLPRQMIRVDCLPRNDRGKICRLSLRSLHDASRRPPGQEPSGLRGEPAYHAGTERR